MQYRWAVWRGTGAGGRQECPDAEAEALASPVDTSYIETDIGGSVRYPVLEANGGVGG